MLELPCKDRLQWGRAVAGEVRHVQRRPLLLQGLTLLSFHGRVEQQDPHSRRSEATCPYAARRTEVPHEPEAAKTRNASP